MTEKTISELMVGIRKQVYFVKRHNYGTVGLDVSSATFLCDEVERLQKALDAALVVEADLAARVSELSSIVKSATPMLVSYAIQNPLWTDFEGVQQDPNGIHKLLAQLKQIQDGE